MTPRLSDAEVLGATEADGDFTDMLDRVRRLFIKRRWWILLTASGVILATVAYLSRLPNRYTSEATLLVVQQQVPLRYVVPNSTTEIAVALEAMKQEVLSRSRLQQIISDFGLYTKVKKRLEAEEMIALILRDIDIIPLANPQQKDNKDFNAFRIAFTTENPLVAQQVTSTLTSLFIQENLKSREAQATNTTSFLHERMDVAKKKLEVQEERLREFKLQHLGELPEQQQGNLGILTSLQTQLQNTMASMSRAQQQRVYLTSLLTGYQAMGAREIPLPGTPEVARRSVNPIDAAEIELARLRSEKASLASKFAPQHPDITRTEREIAAAEAVVEHLKANLPKVAKVDVSGQPAVAQVAGGVPDQPAVAQIKSQLEANRVEMENLSNDEKQLKASLAQYQNRLNLTPVREQQLTGILRDYDLQKLDYTDLVNKALQSELATNLEKNQGGQRFRLVDPPSLPAVPSSPNRLKLSLQGAAGGVILGLVLAFLMDLKDRSFHSEKELSRSFGAPIVVSVPLLFTPAEGRRRTWYGAIQWLAGTVLLLVVCAAEYYVYRQR
jgi:polysaccharide biosynthesis transport protein